LEERTDGVPSTQYLWDPRYVDALVMRWRDADGNSGNGLEETLYYCQDANWNVTAVVSAAGSVVERYVYDPYGKATVLDEDWDPVEGNPSAVANARGETDRPGGRRRLPRR
jgi:YD repeat-containing protein